MGWYDGSYSPRFASPASKVGGVTAPKPADDGGDLPGAITKLREAISGLISPRPQLVQGGLAWIDSWYKQLSESTAGQQGKGHHGVAGSIVPLWTDAVVLRDEIDTAVAAWEPRPVIDASFDDQPPITVIRLSAISRRTWRPQDVSSIDQITDIVASWCREIRDKLNPPPKWSLPNPCPACNTAVVYRVQDGERIRQPALQIGPNGCECAKCHTVWAPQYFQHLASVLGMPLPDGVLE